METMLACIVLFSGSANSNMLIKILKGAKGVAIPTKFTPKNKKAQISVLYAITSQVVGGQQLQICYLEF